MIHYVIINYADMRPKADR